MTSPNKKIHELLITIKFRTASALEKTNLYYSDIYIYIYLLPRDSICINGLLQRRRVIAAAECTLAIKVAIIRLHCVEVISTCLDVSSLVFPANRTKRPSTAKESLTHWIPERAFVRSSGSVGHSVPSGRNGPCKAKHRALIGATKRRE